MESVFFKVFIGGLRLTALVTQDMSAAWSRIRREVRKRRREN